MTEDKMKNVSVEHMRNDKGNTVMNQFLIRTDEGVYFQSYQTVIAFRPIKGKVHLDRESWDCSRTTGKYRNQFLREGIAETRKKIASGEYVLTDLNR